MVRKFLAIGALLLAGMFVASGALAVPIDHPTLSTVTLVDQALDFAKTAPSIVVDEQLLGGLSPGDAGVMEMSPTCSPAEHLTSDPIGDVIRRDDPGWCGS